MLTENVDDAADHPAVVNTRLAARIRRQVRLDPRKLRVREPETIPIHPRFLPEAVNHIGPVKPTTLWGSVANFVSSRSEGR